jgi:hypothetical protein
MMTPLMNSAAPGDVKSIFPVRAPALLSRLAACRLQVEILFLQHQLNIALRRAPHPRLRASDRALFAWMAWLWPRLLGLSSFGLTRCGEHEVRGSLQCGISIQPK